MNKIALLLVLIMVWAGVTYCSIPDQDSNSTPRDQNSPAEQLAVNTPAPDQDLSLTAEAVNKMTERSKEDVVSPEVIKEPIKPAVKPVDYSYISYEITKKDYPKTYARWGGKWIGDINTLMPIAVARVASNSKCDTPVNADLSDNRSTPKKEAVFYVDCSNGERFYVSQNELSGTDEIVSESNKLLGEPRQYIEPCRMMIKSQLSYPSSFDEEFGTTAYKGSSGNMVVEIRFTAKNQLGGELPQAARCVFGTSGENEAIISNR